VEAELPLKEHIYQPVDRNGRPCGGRQRFEYRSDAELIEKLSKAHSAASSRIRELSRDRKLEEIALAGPTAKNFKPSTEVPATMAELSAELLEQRQQNFLLSVREALNAFQLSADWAKYRSKENAESIVLAVSRAGSDPTDPQSFHAAFAQMREFLVPVIPEKIAEVSVPTPVQAAVAVIPEPAVRATRVPMASGLSFADGGDAYEPAPPLKTVQGVRLVIDGKNQFMDVRAWDRLSTDVQKRVLRNPANANAIDSLWAAQEQEQAARRTAAR
jgi:DNA-binding Lrp family transcriptional regulator